MTAAMVLAAFCTAGVVWALGSPPPAAQRLDGLFGARPQPRRTVASGLLRASAGRVERFRERKRQPQRWRAAVIELCDGMAADLAAGRSPDEAFEASAAVLDPRVAAVLLNSAPPTRTTTAAQLPNGGSPPEPAAVDRLTSLADRPGAEGLRLLASCWRIGAERGGTLATVLDGLASALRDEEAQRQEIAAQLAGPRTTARMLALLPLLGLAMAAALGANPLAFLFGTLPGAGCLATGVGLDLAGLWWTRRLAQAAEVPR